MTEARRLGAAERMTEDQLLSSVLELARLMGLYTAHFRPGRTSTGWRTPVAGDGVGFPDLVIAGAGGVAYRELKRVGGQLTRPQQEWLHRLEAAGGDVGVWTPRDWLDRSIAAELAQLAGRHSDLAEVQAARRQVLAEAIGAKR